MQNILGYSYTCKYNQNFEIYTDPNVPYYTKILTDFPVDCLAIITIKETGEKA